MHVKGASKPLLILAVSAATLSGIGGYAWHESRRPAALELFVFDTPGAPAILIRTPRDKRILINGGANSDIVERLTGVLPFYSRRIDLVIATKADAKNATGLIDVLNRYQVDGAVIPSVTLEGLGLASSTDPIYEIFKKTLADKKVPTESVSAGKRIVFDQGANNGDAGTVTADIIFPVSADSAFKYSQASGPETLLRINYGQTSVVLAGSASLKVQKYIAITSLTPADAIIFSHSAVASGISRELVDSLAPDSIIYSQTVTKDPKNPVVVSKAKAKADPLAGILNERRYNVQESGVVKITSDSSSLQIKKTL